MNTKVAKTKYGRLFSFAFAGGSGFIVDIGVLYVLLTFTPMGPFVARIFSIGAAMVSTFVINRTFTFGDSGKGIVKEGVRYSSVALLGAVINYVIYSTLLLLFPGFSPLWATAIAVIIVAFFSYFGYSRFVFGK